MNYVDRRKGPKLEFVIPDHHLEFENSILDIYGESNGLWGYVPSLEEDIVGYIRPKHIYAGLMGKATGNPSWYTQETVGKIIPTFHDIWSTANLTKLAEEGYLSTVQESQVIAAYDAMEVLNFHKMFYAFEVAEGLVLRNAPWGGVW